MVEYHLRGGGHGWLGRRVHAGERRLLLVHGERPRPSGHVVAVAWLDRSPDWDALVDRLERATRLVPIFRQRPVEPPGRLATPRWKLDPDFDLSWHLRRVASPAPHTPGTVLDIARLAAMTGFDTAHPLWEYTLVEDLKAGVPRWS